MQQSKVNSQLAKEPNLVLQAAVGSGATRHATTATRSVRMQYKHEGIELERLREDVDGGTVEEEVALGGLLHAIMKAVVFARLDNTCGSLTNFVRGSKSFVCLSACTYISPSI